VSWDPGASILHSIQKKKGRKEKQRSAAFKLSFDVNEEDDMPVAPKKRRTDAKSNIKNPDVDTSFLPDREREDRERKLREELKDEWLKAQDKLKAEKIQVTYLYWDGNGNRKTVECTKGDSIATFLEKCRNQVPELRGVSVDNLMYIKACSNTLDVLTQEDLILPHHYTFYDFIVNKARGKSGPLFEFNSCDGRRLVQDATIEKQEVRNDLMFLTQTNAGKVVVRALIDH
jgi:protein FAM50A